jgi:hypothetical protein
MPRFDISQAADFSRLTQGTLGNLTSLFGGRNPDEWDIVEASYNGIKFHVFQLSTIFNSAEKVRWDGALSRVTDYGGRRKVKYQFPYKDGQTTDDLGRAPGSFEMEAVIHGPRYMEGYNALMAEFDKPQAGLLVHPVRGEITCAIDKVDITHRNDMRKAMELRLTFIEHNFTIGDVRALSDDSVKGALAAALAVFKAIDKAITTVEGAQLLARGLKNLVKSYLAVFKLNSAKTLTLMNQTFNAKGGSADIPSLLPVNLGGTSTATDATGGPAAGSALAAATANASNESGATIVSDGNFIVVRSVSDPFNGVPVDQLSGNALLATAVPQLAKQVQALRDQVALIITTISNAGAALELFDTVLDMRQSVVLIQEVLEKGVASSNVRVVDYTTPRVMSLREVAFANNIDVNRVEELDILNPQLLSVNHIESGVVVKVPNS